MKDSILRDRLQETALVGFLKDIIPILKEELNPHNIFQKSEDEVLSYLLGIQKEHEVFIAVVDSVVVGGTVLEKKDETTDGQHTVWKLKHFVLHKNIDPEVEQKLIREIEERLKRKSKSIKIQLNLSEREGRYIELFKRYGFKQEAILKNHYRVGETMYIYSKLLSDL